MSSAAPATATPTSPHRPADLLAHRSTVVEVLARDGAASEADQDDQLQDVWVRALRTLPGCTALPEELPRWLAAIAIRVRIDNGRVSRSRRRFMASGAEGSIEWAQAREASVERTLHLRGLIARLWDAVETMSPADRQVFDLHVAEGLTHAAIAARLSITEAASKMRYSRAKGHLIGNVPELADEVLAVLPPVPSFVPASDADWTRRKLRSLYDTTAPLVLFLSTLWAAAFAGIRFTPLQSLAHTHGEWPVIQLPAMPAPQETRAPLPSAPQQRRPRAIVAPGKPAPAKSAPSASNPTPPEEVEQVERTTPPLEFRRH